jgi:hypothetical protein
LEGISVSSRGGEAMSDEDILKKMAEMGPNYAVDYGEDPKNWVMSREDFEHRQEQLRQPRVLRLVASVLGWTDD